MITVRAIYEEGKIQFLEPPPDVARAQVAVVFLETETVEDVVASHKALVETMDWGEPMDEEGARTLVAVYEDLVPYRTEVNEAHVDREKG
jgi:hypothetical protein